MKKIYICGASDCFPDADYPGLSWMEKFESIVPELQVHNLGLMTASNFVIRLQVERALENRADFIIVNFTSSVREEARYNDNEIEATLLDRFYRYNQAHGPTNLVSYSPYTIPAKQTTVLDNQRQQLIYQKFALMGDLDVSVAKNYFLITGTLDRLINANANFIFSTGGFEHPSFLDKPSSYNFKNYESYKSHVNLWDHIKNFQVVRPYFHITDTDTTDMIATYYKHIVFSKLKC